MRDFGICVQEVMHEVVQRVLGMRFKFGDRSGILIKKMEFQECVQEDSSGP